VCSELYYAASTFYTTHLFVLDSVELKELFNQIDTNGDGEIDNHEMTSALSKMGILGPELQTIALSKVDMPGIFSSEVNKMFLEADQNR
jgi:Ca2+-binding EF-hand superfamily protein